MCLIWFVKKTKPSESSGSARQAGVTIGVIQQDLTIYAILFQQHTTTIRFPVAHLSTQELLRMLAECTNLTAKDLTDEQLKAIIMANMTEDKLAALVAGGK
jgi:hypothetical protein